MKKFRFTLEPLRILREREEQEAMENYANALDDQRKALAKLTSIQQELMLAQDNIKTRLVQAAPITQIVHQQLYCLHLEEQAKAALAETKQIERKVKQAMQDMIDARHQREVVDKFLANQRAAFDRAVNVEEQKNIDEMAAHRRETALSWKAPSYE